MNLMFKTRRTNGHCLGAFRAIAISVFSTTTTTTTIIIVVSDHDQQRCYHHAPR